MGIVLTLVTTTNLCMSIACCKTARSKCQTHDVLHLVLSTCMTRIIITPIQTLSATLFPKHGKNTVTYCLFEELVANALNSIKRYFRAILNLTAGIYSSLFSLLLKEGPRVLHIVQWQVHCYETSKACTETRFGSIECNLNLERAATL